MALGLLCLLALVTPVLIIGSQRRLGEAENALYEAQLREGELRGAVVDRVARRATGTV